MKRWVQPFPNASWRVFFFGPRSLESSTQAFWELRFLRSKKVLSFFLFLIETVLQISIRPFWHNEYPRFILRAYPYYLSAVLNLVGVFAFAVVYLYSKEPKAKAVNAAASKTVKAE